MQNVFKEYPKGIENKDVYPKEYILNPVNKEINSRVHAMHEWAQSQGRQSFIIGISGGIDSALSLALLTKMKETYPEYDYNIIPVIAPINRSIGTTGQDAAKTDAVILLEHLGYGPNDYIITDLGEVSLAVNNTLCLEGVITDASLAISMSLV